MLTLFPRIWSTIRPLPPAFMLLLLAGPLARADQSITLRSGNGAIGSQDAQVRFLAYGKTGAVTPAAQDFTTVQTGTFAYVDTPYPTYVKSLPSDPLANWLGTTKSLSPGSALYAIPFTVTDPIIAAASLDLGYSVDNAINGVYINGMPLSNNVQDGDYHGEYYVLRSDIASLLIPNSVNWLYLNVTDGGGFSGLIFSANITTQGAAPGAPTITPAQGGNTGQVSVRIIASGFQPGATLSLTSAGNPIPGTNVTVVSPNILTATIDLSGAAPGVDTVTITNPGGSPVVLTDAFTVLEGGAASLQISKVGNAAVAGYNETFFITVTNTGSVDSGVTPVDELLEPWFTFVASSPQPAAIQSETNPLVTNVSSNYDWSLEWDLPNIGAGESVTIPYTVLLNPDFPSGGTVHGTSCLDPYRIQIADDFKVCILAASISCLKSLKSFDPRTVLKTCAFEMGFCPALRVIQSAYALDKCSQVTHQSRSSKDPNDITGPGGYGPQGWFIPKPPFQYSLAFSNDSTATKSATNVYLIDNFDTSRFDLSTLAIGAVLIGNSSFAPSSMPLSAKAISKDIDLRPGQNLLVRVNASVDLATGIVNVSLLTLDPGTGLTPADPTVGFLAPGAGGSVLFTVQPKSGLTTGMALQDQGSVIFDNNDPIATPVWTNTIDITSPISHVIALPSTEPGLKFHVSWTGNDAGSGIQSYTIYVSDDGGPFTPWLQNTQGVSATYAGKLHHTYAFYSIAADYVGNEESAKTRADAHTKVKPVAKTLLTASKRSAPFGSPVHFVAEVQAPASDPAPAGAVDFYNAGSHLIGKQMLRNGKATIVTSALPAGKHRITAVYAGDAVFPASDSEPIEVSIAKLKPEIKLKASANPAAAGSPVMFQAEVSGAKAAPAGTVVFYVNGKQAARRTLLKSVASYSTRFAQPGTHSVKAVYEGSSEYAEETSRVVEEKIVQ